MIIHQNKYRRMNPALIQQVIGYKKSGPNPTPPAPLAWWELNGAGSVTDLSGNGYNLTGNGSSSGTFPGTSAPAAVYNLSLRMYQVSQGQVTALDFGASPQPFSVSSWINSGTDGCVVNNLDSNANYQGWTMYYGIYPVSHEMTLQLNSNSGKGGSGSITVRTNTGGSLAYNESWHLALTYDGSNHAAGVKLYINGALAPMTVFSDNLVGSASGDQPVSLGAIANNQYTFALTNYQSDTRLWNVALNSAQIATLYTAGPQ